MSSRTWLAIVVFVFMAVLTVVSLVCCGMAMSRSFAYEADIRNNEQRLNDIQQAVEQKQSQNKAQAQRYLDDQKQYQAHLDKIATHLQEQTQRRSDLEKNLPDLQAEFITLTNQINTLKEQKQNLEQELQQVEAAKRELSELSTKITTAKNVEKSLTQSIDTLNKQLVKISGQKDDMGRILHQKLFHQPAEMIIPVLVIFVNALLLQIHLL